MGKRELQIKGNGGKLGLSGEKCIHMNCLMFQGKKYGPVNLPFNPFDLGVETCSPDCPCLGRRPVLGERTGFFSLSRIVSNGVWWFRCYRFKQEFEIRSVVIFPGPLQLSTFLLIPTGGGWFRYDGSCDPGRRACGSPLLAARGPCQRPSKALLIIKHIYICNSYKLKNK